MFYNAKNKRLSIDGSKMDYIAFGKGKKPLIMLPGLGDGLTTVKGKAIPFAIMYKELAKRYRVYCFSRKNALEKDADTRSMANDTAKAMQLLGIENAHVLGVSMGGMIAQYLAIDHPETVDRLILTVTAPQSGEKIINAVGRWIEMAENNDHRSLMIDNVEAIYTESYIKKKHYRAFYPLLAHIGKPKSYERFIIQANACITHNASDLLPSIAAETLIINAAQDKVIDESAPYELNSLIKGSQLKIYEDLGHGAYEESKDFIPDVIKFLEK